MEIIILKKLLKFIIFYLLFLIFLNSNAQNQGNHDFFEGKIIVKVKPAFASFCSKDSISIPKLGKEFEKINVSAIEKKIPKDLLFSNKYLGYKKYRVNRNDLVNLSLLFEIKYLAQITPSEVCFLLKKSGYFEYAEPIKKYDLLGYNDPYTDSLAIKNEYDALLVDSRSGVGSAWHLGAIRALEAWSLEKGDSSVKIGVIDTGINTQHPDIIGNYAFNKADPTDGIDNDDNGFIDDYEGWNLVSKTGVMNAVQQHGTNSASMACLTPNNSIGGIGTGFYSKCIGINAYNANMGYLENFYDGFPYIVARGCKILNLSLGSRGPRSSYEQDMINFMAINHDIVIVAAAGNGRNTPAIEIGEFFPASYNNVISVAQVMPADTPLYSNATYAYPFLGSTNSNYVDISAPGFKSFMAGFWGYKHSYGSSFSSPMVAGAAALLRARFPSYTSSKITALLKATTDDVYQIPANNKFRDVMGTGRLNMYKAVQNDPLSTKYVEFTSKTILGKAFGKLYLPGDTISVNADFYNYFSSLSSASIIFRNKNPNIILIDTILNLGTILSGQKFNNNIKPFKFKFNNLNMPETVRFQIIVTANGLNVSQFFELEINKRYTDIITSEALLTISPIGRFGYDDDMTTQRKLGNGFLNQGMDFINNSGVIFATSTANVSNSVMSKPLTATGDNSFKILSTISETPVPFYDYYNECLYTDTDLGINPNPIGLKIKQKAYSWEKEGLNKSIVIQFDITNIGNSTIDSLKAGIFTDWNVNISHVITSSSSFFNRGYWDNDNNLTYIIATNQPIGEANWVGISLINQLDKPISNLMDYSSYTLGATPFFGLSKSEKYNLMSRGVFRTSAGTSGNGSIIANILGSKLLFIRPGETRTLTLAYHSANSYNELRDNANKVKEQYQKTIGPLPKLKDTTICKGSSLIISPKNGTIFCFYDTIPGIRPALIKGVATYTTPNLNFNKTYWVTGIDSLVETFALPIKVTISSVLPQLSIAKDTLINYKINVSSSTILGSTIWKWGDTQSTSGFSTSHTYPNSGIYNINLIAIDSIGCKTSQNTSLTFLAPPTINGITICYADSVKLTPSGGSNYSFYNEQFKKGIRFAVYKPSFTTNKLIQNTKFLVTNFDGTNESFPTEVWVTVKKTSFDFTYSQDTTKILNYKLKAYPNENKSIFTWEISGQTILGVNAEKSFGSAGIYLTKLKIIDSLSCIYNLSKEIFISSYISPLLIAQPTINGITICSGDTAKLSPLGGGMYNFYNSKFKSGILYSRNKTNFITPKLFEKTKYLITRTDGINESLPIEVEVLIKNTTFDFSYNQDTTKVMNYKFNVTPNEPKASFIWDIAGQTINGSNIEKSFTASGTYFTKLKIHDSLNCSFRLTKEIFILPYSSLNINQHLNERVYIYPNPANEILNISFNKVIPENPIIKIIDSQGKVLHTSIHSLDNKIIIPILHLSKGIYSVQIINKEETFNLKFIVD